ncbi:triosephosphate isomerase [Pseudopedobacter saltans DSM 12145]|uniref:Triosephosphate isomerase n=1 Tax=Pseudopedobacter saltans (strain ATCC 51119 / DSM 12145 / JCM 21818 / CCUG 39354 / LMG 10337 / NBRC 100064 / NCIMB 13643) TaxID=762903 RepID=F0SEN1_PSESL|nr:triose-phosphate isomerase [Pseudopedobacter saltans]ADY51921.1 triosephosphate isomerase [Pseudopedobacter saltans DSM 12145]
MRKKIVAGNWKMNKDYSEGLSLFSEVLNMVKDEVRGEQQVVVCAPYIHLHSLSALAKGTNNVFVGAQNAHQEASGAYTGEISTGMLKSVGVEYVILGHSERRQYFGENNELLAKKTNTALANDLKPIFCIGETLAERESNQHFDVIKTQLAEATFHLSAEDFSKLVIAYEPVWAIGTGVTASSAQAQEIHAFIRSEVAAKYGAEVAENTTILYGGSCNPGNAAELFAQKDIDGGLIGGASLKSRDFVDIVKTFNN